MKEKLFTQNFKHIIFTLFLLIISEIAIGQIVGYNLYDNEFSTTGLALNHPGGVFTTTASVLGYIGDAVMTDSWDLATPGGLKSWTITPFTTVGYHTIKASAKIYSESTGPRDFSIEYKTSAGANWVSAGTITATTSTTQYQIDLPTECRNTPTLYLRWIATSYTSTSGGIISPTSLCFISDISITGNLPQTPSNQASAISIVSVTPRTITIDCTPGNGDNRIIVISSANDFKTIAGPTPPIPTDNVLYLANQTYNGSGQQVIYSGSGTKVTVTVPDSKNIYYFKAFDFINNGGMTRYIYSNANNNPRQCALEIITPNIAKNVRITSATLGATITEPIRSSINLRGIVWRTSPGVLETDNKSYVSGILSTAGGSFEKAYTSGVFPRSTIIYYKGFVRNQSGTIYSEESSFDNKPIFAGTGNWETDNQWNVQQVPGSGTTYGSILDKPTINGVCTLSTNTSCNSLIINPSKNLTINPSSSLSITTSITNNAGNSGLLIKSSETNPNGSLIFNNPANSPVSGTVEMYSKAKWDLTKPAGNKYSWQFFGLPIKTQLITPTFSGAFVRKWEETGKNDVDLWVMQNSGTTLTSTTGYELVQSAAKTYTFAGQLENQGFTRSLPYTVDAVFPGQHIFGNPFTSAINIEKIQFGANTENSVYLYNTGTYNEWDINSGEIITGEGHGQYTVTTPKASGGLGIPSQIPSMQGFLVKSINATGSITIPYNSSVANTDMQRTKTNKEVSTNEKVITRIDIKSTHYFDRMWIFTSPECTRSFDNGWDGPKMLGSIQRTQLFSMEKDGNYQINAVQNINDTYLGFQPGDEREFKLIFTHQNIESAYAGIYLIDLAENKTLDVTTSGSEYSFTSEPSIAISKRFKIVTKPTNANFNKEQEEQFQIFHNNSAIFVQNFSENNGILNIYSTSGATLKKLNFNANTVTSFSTNDLSQGVYVAKAFVDKKELTLRIIVR